MKIIFIYFISGIIMAIISISLQKERKIAGKLIKMDNGMIITLLINNNLLVDFL
jgi:small nuclear ribonucleoprotein (snRNP)-like protein